MRNGLFYLISIHPLWMSDNYVQGGGGGQDTIMCVWGGGGGGGSRLLLIVSGGAKSHVINCPRGAAC